MSNTVSPLDNAPPGINGGGDAEPLKLKRLLLRYHPPGIGLEVHDGTSAEAEVIHKDLPPSEEIENSGQIRRLVDELLDEEGLLNRKKHEKSLIQLLGRLYQIDIEDVEGAIGRGNTKAYPEGVKVCCYGFNGQNAVYNGQLGVVTRAIREKKTKYEVTFDNNSVVKVKENHILHVLNDGKPFRPGTIPSGQRAIITGLRNHGDLNGTVGRVTEWSETISRYEIRAGGQLFRVKADNILPCFEPDEEIPPVLQLALVGQALREEEINRQKLGPGLGAGIRGLGSGNDDGIDPALLKPQLLIPAGATIQLAHLRNAGWLNGQTAEVLSVDQERRRYEIRIHADNSIKKVKAENVQLLGGSENAAGAGLNTGGAGHTLPFGVSGSGGGGQSGYGGGGQSGFGVGPGMQGGVQGGDQSSPRGGRDDLVPGTRIELCNLKTAASLNGERAQIVGYDAGRYEIRMEMDGSSKQVRRDNFRVIGVPMV